MDNADVFINFRPIYVLFIIMLIISLFIIIVQKNHKIINGYTVILTLAVSSIVSAFMTYQIGILSDELGIGGDSASTIMFFAVIVLNAVNFFVYLFKK